MYHQRSPYYHRQCYPNIIPDRKRIPTRETLWRISWPYIFTLILASLMLIFIIIIFVLEIASLVTDNTDQLSNTASTGAGIWCSIVFMVPVVLMFLLVLAYDSSRIFSTYTLIAHLIALVFIFILIGLTANAVTPYNTMVTSAPTKIKILRGQLALAILMILFPIGFIAAYIYTAFKSLYPLRAHIHSINPPFPIPPRHVKY